MSNKITTSGVRHWESRIMDMIDGKVTHFEEIIKNQILELIKEKNYECSDLLSAFQNDAIVYPAALEIANALGLDSIVMGYCLPGNKLTAAPFLADLKESGFNLKARYAIINMMQVWKNEFSTLAEFNNQPIIIDDEAPKKKKLGATKAPKKKNDDTPLFVIDIASNSSSSNDRNNLFASTHSENDKIYKNITFSTILVDDQVTTIEV